MTLVEKFAKTEAIIKADDYVDPDTSIMDRFNGLLSDYWDTTKKGTTNMESEDHREFMQDLRSLDFKTVYNTIFGGNSPQLGKYQSGIAQYAKAGGKLLSKSLGTVLATSTQNPVVGEIGAWVADNFITKMADAFIEKPVTGYRYGEWVYVDMMRKVKHKETTRKEEYSEIAMFGDYDPEIVNMNREDYSVGFYVEVTESPSFHLIFVFEMKRVLKIRNDCLRPMTNADALLFDENPTFSLIRELFILKESDADFVHTGKQINLESGAEVIYKDNLCYVFQYLGGDKAIIEDIDGKRTKVFIRDLKRGRSNTSTAGYYAEGSRSFHHAKFTSGDFVWIEPLSHHYDIYPNVTYVLCCLSYFDGSDACVFCCYNSEMIWVDEDDLKRCNPHIQEILRSNKEFARFRKSAAESNTDIVIRSIGTKFLDTCFGHMEGFDNILYNPIKDPNIIELNYNATIEPEPELLVESKNKGLEIPGEEEESPTRREREKFENEQSSTNTYMLLAGGVALVALFYANR